MVRGGKIDVVVLGAYQVDSAGNVANWRTPEQVGGGIGGAMDLVASGRTVMVLMEHRDSRDRAKLVRSCTYPLTGAGCVDIVVTDLAVVRRRDGLLTFGSKTWRRASPLKRSPRSDGDGPGCLTRNTYPQTY